jgi:hypothetical protein
MFERLEESMNTLPFRLSALLVVLSLLLVPSSIASAQERDGDLSINRNQSATYRALGSLPLQINGAVMGAANQPIGFVSGVLSINRFARQNNQIVAIGIVRGTVYNLSHEPLSSGLQSVVLPVRLSNRTVANFNSPSPSPKFMPASFTLVQAQPCGILHLDIGGNAINLLGFNVTLTPVTLDISGDSAGPLGALVCEVLALLGNVANVVGLLNSLLGLITGLLG